MARVFRCAWPAPPFPVRIAGQWTVGCASGVEGAVAQRIRAYRNPLSADPNTHRPADVRRGTVSVWRGCRLRPAARGSGGRLGRRVSRKPGLAVDRHDGLQRRAASGLQRRRKNASFWPAASLSLHSRSRSRSLTPATSARAMPLTISRSNHQRLTGLRPPAPVRSSSSISCRRDAASLIYSQSNRSDSVARTLARALFAQDAHRLQAKVDGLVHDQRQVGGDQHRLRARADDRVEDQLANARQLAQPCHQHCRDVQQLSVRI